MTTQSWLNRYPENAPHTINSDKYESVTQLFQSSVEQYPDHLALECFGAPDEKTGERVKLFVAPSGKGDLDVDAVTEYCRANLAA